MSMFCTQCGQQIPEDSIFCTFCGTALNHPVTEEKPEKNVKKEKTKEESRNEVSKTSTLFDKFAEIHDLKGDEKTKFFNTSTSIAALHLLEKIEKNAIDNLLKEATELKERKHSLIELIQHNLFLATLGGYEIFLAKRTLDGEALESFKEKPELDKLSDEWIKVLKEDSNASIKMIPDEVIGAILKYRNFRVDSLQGKYKTEIESLSHNAFEKFEEIHMTSVIWGYFVGLVESKYRSNTINFQ